MSNYLDILAKNINWFLEKNYKKPAWLAEVSGVKAPNLSKILGRMGNPTLETIEALAAAMDMYPADLVRRYKDDKSFEIVMLSRRAESLEATLSGLQKKYDRAVGDRPHLDIHPVKIQKEMDSIREDLKKTRSRIDNLSGQSASETSKPTHGANPQISRDALLLSIFSRLASTPLNEDQLLAVSTLIEVSLSTSDSSATNSTAKS